MDRTQFDLSLIGGEDDETASFEMKDQGEACLVTCNSRGQQLTGEGRDFFDAFREVRNALWQQGLIPYCYGASLNVWPSGMGREMGRGLKAYKSELGLPATELVGIFDEGPDIIPANVERQEEYHRDWINSLRTLT
jgi:hypothetical protein